MEKFATPPVQSAIKCMFRLRFLLNSRHGYFLCDFHDFYSFLYIQSKSSKDGVFLPCPGYNCESTSSAQWDSHIILLASKFLYRSYQEQAAENTLIHQLKGKICPITSCGAMFDCDIGKVSTQSETLDVLQNLKIICSFDLP